MIFHGIIIGALIFVAAREGILGKDLKKIAVTMVPKEKPPEKPKEKPPEPKPEVVPPKPEPPKPVATVAQIAKTEVTPPPATTAAPVAAPAARSFLLSAPLPTGTVNVNVDPRPGSD